MPLAFIDGINARYEVLGSGPPLLMFSPGGFEGTLEKWTTAGVYVRTRILDHLECLPQAEYWDVLPEGQTGETAPGQLPEFLDMVAAGAR